jgi:hypothetical protein
MLQTSGIKIRKKLPFLQFRRILAEKNLKKYFKIFDHGLLKNPPRGYDKDHQLMTY